MSCEGHAIQDEIQQPAKPRKSLSEVFVDAYHRHLDECAQCREHPFAQCRVGDVLLRSVATTVASELITTLAPGGRAKCPQHLPRP